MQAAFTAALLGPDLPAPDTLRDPAGRPAGKRFDVYRNNVAVSLTEALITGFPAIHKLVSDEFFRAMAGIYLRAHPPKSPLMMHYGADFPDFLQGFGPAAKLLYLPDVARLELALRRAYHAADAAPISTEALMADPDALMTARLEFAPAMQVLDSRWPVLSIWKSALHGGPRPEATPQEVAILRPDYDARPFALPKGGAAVLRAMQQGQTIADALAPAPRGFDLSALVGVLLAGKAIISRSGGTDA